MRQPKDQRRSTDNNSTLGKATVARRPMQVNHPNVSGLLLVAGATESDIKPQPLGFKTLHFVVHGSGLSGPWFPDSASTLLCLLLPSPHRFVLTSGSLRSSGKSAASYVPADFLRADSSTLHRPCLNASGPVPGSVT